MLQMYTLECFADDTRLLHNQRYEKCFASDIRLVQIQRHEKKHEQIQKQLGVRGATGVLLRGIGFEVVGRRAIRVFFLKFVELFDF